MTTKETIYQVRCSPVGEWMDVGSEKAMYTYQFEDGYETRVVRAEPPRAFATGGTKSMASGWISVDDHLPKCNRKIGSAGVEVLVWPRDPVDATAFYGRRVTDKPTFYRYGAVLTGVTHWMPLPDAPVDGDSNG